LQNVDLALRLESAGDDLGAPAQWMAVCAWFAAANMHNFPLLRRHPFVGADLRSAALKHA